MRLGRMLRGAVALSVCAIGSQNAIAGSVDDRFPFLSVAEASKAPEPRMETANAVTRPALITSTAASHRHRASVPYPRPAPSRAGKAASGIDFSKPTTVEPQAVKAMVADAAPSELAAANAEAAQAVALTETTAPSDTVIAVASAITVQGDVAVAVAAPSNEPAANIAAKSDSLSKGSDGLRPSVGSTSSFTEPSMKSVAYAADPSAYPSPTVSVARGLSIPAPTEPPAQTVAARMAPLDKPFQTASRTVDDPAPEPADAMPAHSAQNVGGPFVPMPKQRAIKLSADDIVILVENTAVAHGVPLELAHAVVRVESNYNPGLTGRGGTLGLMQIKYATARGIGYSGTAKALMDPAVNLEWGMRYLAGARKLAKGSVCGTILRYQAGHRAVHMTQAAAQYCGRVRHIMAAIR